MIKAFLGIYRPKFFETIAYMLQSSEYNEAKYLKWFWTTQNFNKVINRGKLDKTKAAKSLLYILYLLAFFIVAIGILCIILWHSNKLYAGWTFGLALMIGYPIIIANIIVIPLFIGRLLVINPSNNKKILKSEKIFKEFKGEKIAIVGSYGKTSMKELLVNVLGDYLKVAATPGNKNVAISHANFAFKLNGDEDVLIIEYGEGKPRDVELFTRITHPTRAIITGLAPAHLDKYKTLQAAGDDIFSVTNFVEPEKVYVNQESKETESFLQPKFNRYSKEGVNGWKVGAVQSTITGLSFNITKGKTKLRLSSKLVGQHHIGALVLAASLALELGLNEEQVEAGIAKTEPYEHRMQPYELSGAWVIDDTYNGNIEGIRVGCELLSSLKAKRKIYVTPGLVDQGKETKEIHKKLGGYIAQSDADIVVLMKNSVSDYIKQGLLENGFKNKIMIEPEPLKFYKNLSHFIASGDVVLMQNDWPDQYK
jgi:UDP-N-acetylmuramoyl-tripeptide--D-alanyl-D-alanine ligase